MKSIAVAALVLLLAVPSATAGSESTQSSVLTALADIGTVYWRFDCTRGEPQRWAIGVRLFDTATTGVTWETRRRSARRTLQPKETAWFPLTTIRRQRLVFVQGTEAGTLRGAVSVDFGRGRVNHCESYLPPHFAGHLSPR
jgi:hypothetical protein